MPQAEKPVRLLQVFNQYLEKGGEEIWVDAVSSLATPSSYQAHNLRFQSSDWTRKGAPTVFAQARKVWDNPASRDRLRCFVANLQPDVLLYHNLIPVGSLGLYKEAEELNLPVVQYIHNFRPFSPSGTMWLNGKTDSRALAGNPWPEILGRAWERSFLKTFLIATYQRRLLNSGGLNVVKRWIAVSDFMRDRFIDAGLDPSRIVTLRHCWRPGPEPQPTEEGQHYLFLGRLVPEKGVHTLLDAWQILEKRMGKDCPRLIIAGSGPEKEVILRRINRMRSVICVGYAEGAVKQRLLAQCRALIAPSIWWEPLGLIVHEAYDAAKPVIAASSGGLTETVWHEKTGLLHHPGDPSHLANNVEMLEQLGKDRRQQMGRAGREWLIKNASPEQWIQAFANILRSALDSSNRP